MSFGISPSALCFAVEYPPKAVWKSPGMGVQKSIIRRRTNAGKLSPEASEGDLNVQVAAAARSVTKVSR